MKHIALLAAAVSVFATGVADAQLRIDEEALQNLESITLLPIVLRADVEFDIMALTDDEMFAMYSAFVELFKELPEKEY